MLNETKDGLGLPSQSPQPQVPVTSATGSALSNRCGGFVPYDPDDTDITNPNIQRGHLAAMQRHERRSK